MRRAVQFGYVIAVAAAPIAAAASSWQPVEKVEAYPVSGASGAELYASIGERGPKLSIGTRAIAQTSFKLTWTRNYETRGNACVLATAKPKLIITYVLPKPRSALPEPLKANWETFIAGVRAHERVHGDYIVEMVRQIEAATVGLTVPDDPKCRKIKDEMTKRLGALSQAQRQRSRDFDRIELSPGGNVHSLILQLVNGG